MNAARIDFTEYDERAIRGAARSGSIVAVSSIITAIIAGALETWTNVLVGFTPLDVLDGVVPGLEILLNVWLLVACRSFRKVANTDEADQAHLLAGFRHLRLYVAGQAVTILAVLGLGLVGAVLVVSAY